MNKNRFVLSVEDLCKYAQNINEASDVLDVELGDGVIGNILDGWGEELLTAILPETIEEGHVDYFFEKFWNMVYDASSVEIKWETFYDEAVKGVAPESYLKHFGFM